MQIFFVFSKWSLCAYGVCGNQGMNVSRIIFKRRVSISSIGPHQFCKIGVEQTLGMHNKIMQTRIIIARTMQKSLNGTYLI
jgi:hypothetical protein